ncbi:hypothetical protein BH09VER1_BH09VER1_12030 [soil metagenome]
MKKGTRKEQLPDRPNWRRIGWLVFVLFIVAAGLCTAIIWNTTPARLTENDREFLRSYEEIRSALASDDLQEARAAAADLKGERDPLGLAAVRLAASTTLASARDEFKVLSNHAVALARHQAGFYIVQCIEPCPAHCSGCPMDRFGKWVQVTPKVANPFLGRTKPGCGRVSDL